MTDRRKRRARETRPRRDAERLGRWVVVGGFFVAAALLVLAVLYAGGIWNRYCLTVCP